MTNTLALAMRSKESYFFLLCNLFKHISKKRRYQLIGYFLLLLTSSLTEIVSIGSIVPFLSILTSPESIQNLPFYNLLKYFSQKISDFYFNSVLIEGRSNFGVC